MIINYEIVQKKIFTQQVCYKHFDHTSLAHLKEHAIVNVIAFTDLKNMSKKFFFIKFCFISRTS